MQQFMGAIGRKCSVVNLDPANDRTSYEAAVDVRELVTLESVMDGGGDEGDGVGLGPNGGVLYALEELEENFEWLEERLKNSVPDWEAEYVLFDCPGQVELFTHHASLRRIFARLEKRMGYRVRLRFSNSPTVFFPRDSYSSGPHALSSLVWILWWHAQMRNSFALGHCGACADGLCTAIPCTGGLCDAKKRVVRMYKVY
jgi:hypothetical protein